ncbi:alpha-N-acetylgalactosaminide alpha-2,6-sialyltransferase 2 isoform X2 [Conger conger]|uniref:alpha-N-acetylgalactosaminide alpha-2,6-sialyltransferase 2 isoform X2 n=1 Tax=Conger conger TaxID=82655 RepID=UPI002A59FCD2|nr:alpha-N-acetylgalactosaminide alpha-2,6-sialyltransferase 2 isoform X2 [Conger conger]
MTADGVRSRLGMSFLGICGMLLLYILFFSLEDQRPGHTPQPRPLSQGHPPQPHPPTVSFGGTLKPPTPDLPKPPPPPSEPPFIGDHYAQDDLEPLSNCSTGIWQRIMGTVFALEASLAALNSSASRRMCDDWATRGRGSACIRCAVVGNGGILRGSRRGQEIDQHHYVFRTNGAVIEGFEEDVGSRTSLYTFSTNTMRNSLVSYASVGYTGPPISEETRYVFLPDHDRDYLLLRAAVTHQPVDRGPERSKRPPTYFGEHVTAQKFKMYHPDFIRYLRNRFLRSSVLKTQYRDIYRPSTGAVMLLAALHTCDQVSAYGFMTPDYRKYSDHYYDNQFRPVGFFINHDLRLEMSLWQQLHQAGLIRLYMRP